jgi:hypothetical protein
MERKMSGTKNAQRFPVPEDYFRLLDELLSDPWIFFLRVLVPSEGIDGEFIIRLIREYLRRYGRYPSPAELISLLVKLLRPRRRPIRAN